MRLERFFDRDERELLASAEKRGVIELLCAISKRLPVSLGCHCSDPRRCHRTELVELLRRVRRAGMVAR